MRIKSVKDFRRGDKVTYRFPKSSETKVLIGTVSRKSKTYVELCIDGRHILKISNQHLCNIECVERVVNSFYSLN